MSVIDSAAFERAIRRYGDELYQLALLLAPNETSAARSLLSAARRLALAQPPIDEAALIAALVAALPEERRDKPRRRAPVWALRSPRAPLLAALARLPREQLLALGLCMLRAYEPAQVAQLIGADEAALRAILRAALLDLAPHAGIAHADLLDEAAAPPDCQPTRAALALDAARPPGDPTRRGHLALCSACRAAEQAWLELTNTLEEALRAALRAARLPDQLAEQLRAAVEPLASSITARLLADARARIALVMLPVALLIAILVWPHGGFQRPPGASDGAVSGVPPAPRELVRRAQAQLYAPPEGRGVWHSTYAIQWVFAGNNSAPLAADEWLDPASGRHRLQLVHRAGGGPYEYELADTPDRIWYAISQAYRPSIYLLGPYVFPNLVHMSVSPEQRQQMLAARLRSGAWDIAANYLRQAAAAELRAWGRQRDADGRLIDLVSFAGVSPLALPPDAPAATASRVTVLLAIDEDSGRLREVRELLGEAGSEQTTRTTWRVTKEEWLDDPQAIDRVFDQRLAWNGVGTFVERTGLAQPALPLVDNRQIVPFARTISEFGPLVELLPAAPPNTSAALLIDPAGPAVETNGLSDLSSVAWMYLGAGRQLELLASFADQVGAPPLGAEAIDLNGRQLMLMPGIGQVYQAQLALSSDYGGPPPVLRIGARGYARGELLALLSQLRPATLEAYLAQARLFPDPFPRTPAFDALIGALDRPAPDGAVEHTVERIVSRQGGAPDQLPDPYHRPRYDGRTEEIFRESWRRGTIISDTLEISATERNSDQRIIAREYSYARQWWNYVPALRELTQEQSNTLAEQIWDRLDRRLIVHILSCGAGQVQTNADGTRTVFQSSADWKSGSCLYISYRFMREGQIDPLQNQPDDLWPYLADIADDTLTTWVDLDAAGQAIRAEVRTGTQRSGALLEGWERVSSEQLPAAQVAPATFDPAPPAALVSWQNDPFSFPAPPNPHEIALTNTLELVRTPLFALAEAVSGTASLAPPPVAQLTIQGTKPATPPHPRWLYSDRTPFDAAVLDGYALRVTSRLGNGADSRDVDLYQGEAARLGAYLRSTAHWRTSIPVVLQVDGKLVNGWQVVTVLPGAELWTLFELDGTLVCLRVPPEGSDAVLARLRPIER